MRTPLLLLLLALGWQSRTFGQDLSEILADPPPKVAHSDTARLFANQRPIGLSGNLVVPRSTKILLHIELLSPGSFVEVTVSKTGKKLEHTRYKANQKGEVVLEITTPRSKVGATLVIDYQASSGKRNRYKGRILFR